MYKHHTINSIVTEIGSSVEITTLTVTYSKHRIPLGVRRSVGTTRYYNFIAHRPQINVEDAGVEHI